MAISVRWNNKINIPQRTALAQRVTGRPISKLLPAKFTMISLISLPFLQKASADVGLTNTYHSAASSPVIQKVSVDLGLIKADLGILFREISNDPIGYLSANMYSTAGVLLGFGLLEVLLVMRRHQSHKFQEKLIDDPKTGSKKLIALCRKSKYPDIRIEALKRCKDVPEKVLLKIAEKDAALKVRDAAIRHKNYPESAVLEQISNVREAEAAILERLRSMPLPEEVWIKLLNKHDTKIREVLVHKLRSESQKFSEDTVRALFTFQYPELQAAVLEMEGTEIPEDVVMKAAISQNNKVKLAAFRRNLNMPAELLKAHIKDALVKQLVLEHPNTPSLLIAEDLYDSYVMAKFSSNVDLSAITSVLKQHSSQKKSEILDYLEKRDPSLTKEIGNI